MAGQFTWHNADLKLLINKLPRNAERSTTRVAEYLARRASEVIVEMGAVRTGELRDSVHVTRDESSGGRRVTVRARHGIHVNYGTYSMPARPFWEQAVEDAEDFFGLVLQDEMFKW